MPHELTAPKHTAKEMVHDAILDLVIHVPPSREKPAAAPAVRAQAIARHAARRASVTAGSLSVAPGFMGWLTLVPEMLAVWKLQAQMVSDIAGAYGKEGTLGREQMLYCLFKQVSAQLLRDVAVRAGERMVFRQLSAKVMQSITQKIGTKVSQTLLTKGVSRFIPVLGAMGVGAYAYIDTLQVAKNAIALFEGDVITERS